MAKKLDQKHLSKYLTRIETAENDRDTRYRDRWARFYKRWRNVVDEIKDEHGKVLKERSNISIPYSFVQLETILPRLVETLFAARPYVTVRGRPMNYKEWLAYRDEPEKPWDKSAAAQEMLLDYQQNTPFDIQDKFHVGLKIMGLYGTTVAFVGWKYEERKRIRKQLTPVQLRIEGGEPEPLLDENKQPVQSYRPVPELETTYDDPELKFLDLGLFFVDPTAEDINDARYCGHRGFETRAYIQAKHDDGIWQVDWKKIGKASTGNNARDYRQSIVGMPSTTVDEALDDEQTLYEVHYYWEDDMHVVIINRCCIVLEGPNPFYHKRKPYVKDTYTKDPGEFYGLGIIEVVEDLQDELNTERNQRIDFRSSSLRRMFTQRRGAEVTPRNWELKMNGRILVEEHDDIKELRMNPITGDSFTQESIIKSDMQDATGAHDVVMGSGGSGNTATETMTTDNNASLRFKLIISSAEKKLLVGVSRLMIQLNQQFITEPRILDLDGDQSDQFLEISPEDIQGEFRLTAAGSSVEPSANKEAYKQRLVQLYSIVAKDPFMGQFPLKRRNLLKKIYEAFDFKDTDDLLPSDEELAAFQQQMTPPQPAATGPPAMSESPAGANIAAQSERGLQLR